MCTIDVWYDCEKCLNESFRWAQRNAFTHCVSPYVTCPGSDNGEWVRKNMARWVNTHALLAGGSSGPEVSPRQEHRWSIETLRCIVCKVELQNTNPDDEPWCTRCDPGNTWEGEHGTYIGPYPNTDVPEAGDSSSPEVSPLLDESCPSRCRECS